MDLIQRYGDSDDDDRAVDEHDDGSGGKHDELNKPERKLPVPDAIISMFDGKSYHPKPNSDPASHQGRARLFEHERGNWATYVYVPCPNLQLINMYQEKLKELGLEIIDNPHISLTRTVVLQYHWIQRFVNDVKSKLSSIERFKLTLGNLEVFCNDNRTRTFIGFLAHPQDVLSECVNQLDIVLSDYDLPKYYEDPKFHLSVAWCLGDQSSQLKTKLKSLESELKVDMLLMLKVSKLMCKTGNKMYTFKLSE